MEYKLTMDGRKLEDFDDDLKKWKIRFDVGAFQNVPDSKLVGINFIKEIGQITEEDLEGLKQDLRDLGKLREYKKAKKNIDL